MTSDPEKREWKNLQNQEVFGQTRKPWSNSHALRALFCTWKGAWKVSTIVVWLRLKLNTKICRQWKNCRHKLVFWLTDLVADSISVVEEGLRNKFLKKLQLKGVDRWDISWCKPISPGRAWTVRRRAVWRIVAKESMFVGIENVGFFWKKHLKTKSHLQGAARGASGTTTYAWGVGTTTWLWKWVWKDRQDWMG